MKRSPRVLILLAMAATTAAALAENYQPIIYAPPFGYDAMTVTGAGGNGMVSGYASVSGGQAEAIYMTQQGTRQMHPSGHFRSHILDSWGNTYHCGSAASVDLAPKAQFWVGGGAPVPLHPSGAEYTGSQAEGGGGQLQVGWVSGTFPCAGCGHASDGTHAAMWSRTASSFSRLHSPNHTNVRATATDGVRQVGFGINMSGSRTNALLWNGPNSVAVNLHPAGYDESALEAISGNQQGGLVKVGIESEKAALWTNTAVSMVVLHPSGWRSSRVNAIRNGLQVGEGHPAYDGYLRLQAVAWHGSFASWINLHSRLPAPYVFWHSTATDIDEQGNIVGYVYNGDTGVRRPVIWKRI